MEVLGTVLSIAIDMVWIWVLVSVIRAIVLFIRGGDPSSVKGTKYVKKLYHKVEKRVPEDDKPEEKEKTYVRIIDSDGDVYDSRDYDDDFDSDDEDSDDYNSDAGSGNIQEDSYDPFSGSREKEKQNPFES